MATSMRSVTGRFRRGVPPGDLRSAAIVEAMQTPACALDENGRIIAANQAVHELLGATGHGLRNRSWASLTYPADVELGRAALYRLFEEGLDREQVDTRSMRLDNRELVWGTWDLSLLRDGRGRPEVAVAVVRDRTEIVRSEQERRFFEFLLKIIGEAEDSEAVMAAAVQTICHFTRCGMGQVWVPSGDVLVTSPIWYHSGYGFDQLRAASQQVRYEHGAGLPGLTAATGQPYLLTDVRDPARFDRASAARRAGVQEALAVPVVTSAGLVAVLEFFVTDDRAGEAGRLDRIARVVGELGPLIERKQAEQSLRHSEERFRQVTSAARDAIISADANGVVVTWNTGAERMFGWTAEEIIGQPLTTIIPERFRELHEAGIARIRESGQAKLDGQVLELEGLRKDGSEFPIELSLGAWEAPDGIAFSGIIRDVTERRKAEEALRESEKLFRGVTSAATDAIISAGGDGRVRSWNTGAERMFGWTAEEIIGQPLTTIIPERFRELHEAGIARVRDTRQSKLAGRPLELVGLRKDGSEFPIELSLGFWEAADGVMFSGIIRDITERKKAEEALNALNRELERANAELETLVYSASHDLKSPMVSLLGYLEYLKLDYGEVLGEEGGRYVERIFDRALYMQRLIDDLIELSRTGRATSEPVEVDLGELARTVVDQAASAHPEARFAVHPLPTIVGDPVSFRQLLTNLVENALRHSGRPDVTVTIASGTLEDGSLELGVTDDGKGIPAEHRERVFGVFERLDGSSPGTGMGLAICRKVVELLGGSIEIHDGGGPEHAPGTRIRIVLPASVTVRWPSTNDSVTDHGALV